MSAKRKQIQPKAVKTLVDGIEFGIGEILSVATDWGFSDFHDVNFLLGYLHGLQKDQEFEAVDQWKRAKESAAEWICKQLPWAKSAADSLQKFRGSPEEWLEDLTAKYGEFHRLTPISGAVGAADADVSREDPLASIADKSDEEAKADLVSAGRRSKEGRIRARITDARKTIKKLMGFSKRGSKPDLVELHRIACDIVRFFEMEHPDFIREVSEFPVVISALKDERKRQFDKFTRLPIGSAIGFPIPRPVKGGTDEPGTPSYCWRQIQDKLIMLRKYCAIAGGDLTRLASDMPWNADHELLRQIALLHDFDEQSKAEWILAAAHFVDQNRDMNLVPVYLFKVSADRGFPAKFKEWIGPAVNRCIDPPAAS